MLPPAELGEAAQNPRGANGHAAAPGGETHLLFIANTALLVESDAQRGLTIRINRIKVGAAPLRLRLRLARSPTPAPTLG